MLLTKRSSCAPHDDSSSTTYDSNGNVCATLSGNDKYFIAGAVGVCGTTLIILGIIYLRRWRRARADETFLKGGLEPMTSRADAPLIIHGTPYQPSFAVGSDSGHSGSSQGASPSDPYSPYFGSDQSHVPILSADGHLISPLSSPSEPTWSDENLYPKRALPPVPGYAQVAPYEPQAVGIYQEEDIAHAGNGGMHWNQYSRA